MKEVLIAGGSGLIGSRLGEILLKAGYNVAILARGKRTTPINSIKQYTWDPENGVLPNEAILNADYVVNLGGATIGKRWTKAYKQELIDSRVKPTQLIVEKLNTLPHHAMSLLNISAIGYYGNNSEQVVDERSPSNGEFISKICQEWERAAEQLDTNKAKLFILRIATVVSERGGAIPQMAMPVKLFIGSGLGSGDQGFPWLHIDDLCHAILWCVENPDKADTYNVASPEITTNKELIKAIAKHFKRPVFMPNIPGCVLKLVLGEFADSVTGSIKVSSAKIQAAGFRFQFPEIVGAIEDIYKRGV